jgi:hypothetical protein
MSTKRTAFLEILFHPSAGMWYDALMAVSNLIDDTPDNPAFHKHRAALLEQVGLSAVAQ